MTGPNVVTFWCRVVPQWNFTFDLWVNDEYMVTRNSRSACHRIVERLWCGTYDNTEVGQVADSIRQYFKVN